MEKDNNNSFNYTYSASLYELFYIGNYCGYYRNCRSCVGIACIQIFYKKRT